MGLSLKFNDIIDDEQYSFKMLKRFVAPFDVIEFPRRLLNF